MSEHQNWKLIYAMLWLLQFILRSDFLYIPHVYLFAAQALQNTTGLIHA